MEPLFSVIMRKLSPRDWNLSIGLFWSTQINLPSFPVLCSLWVFEGLDVECNFFKFNLYVGEHQGEENDFVFLTKCYADSLSLEDPETTTIQYGIYFSCET